MNADGLKHFLNSFSNRIEVIDVPDNPVYNEYYASKVPWWDVYTHGQHQYFELRARRNGQEIGQLHVYVATTNNNFVVYCWSAQR